MIKSFIKSLPRSPSLVLTQEPSETSFFHPMNNELVIRSSSFGDTVVGRGQLASSFQDSRVKVFVRFGLKQQLFGWGQGQARSGTRVP